MADDGGEAGKAEDDFVDAFGGRVACEGRPHVGVEQRAHGGKHSGEILQDVRGAARRINAAVAFPLLGERKLELDLPGERAQGALERADDERVEIGRAQVGRAEVTRIEGADQALDDVDDGLARGQRRRRAAIAALLRSRSEAAKLGGDRDEIGIAVRLRTWFAQCAHAARPLASKRPSNRIELR